MTNASSLVVEPATGRRVLIDAAYEDVVVRLEAELQKQISTIGIRHDELPTEEELR